MIKKYTRISERGFLQNRDEVTSQMTTSLFPRDLKLEPQSHLLMHIEDQMCSIGNNEPVLPIPHAFRLVLLQLVKQAGQVDHDAVSCNRKL